MAYRTLKSIFHQHDRAGLVREERVRRNSPSAIHWDLLIGDSSAFMLVTREVAVLVERILTLEPRIRHHWDRLPGRAQSDYLAQMIVDEVQATNEIEQVRSTRKEIGEALEALRADAPIGGKRFTEMVRLYMGIGNADARAPQTLDDLRGVYDAVTAGEVGADAAPDSARFRTGPVTIESGTKVVHRGVVPESAIDEALTVMMSQTRDVEIPRLLRAVVAHFIFEFAHPFHDGNGRTGRYLLALDLREVLAPYSSLALSATIADNKDRYYRAFADAEEPLNRGDLTVFVTSILEIIAEAQHRLLTDLSDRAQKIEALNERIGDFVSDGPQDGLVFHSAIGNPFDLADIGDLLFILGQAWLFDVNRAIKLQSLVRTTGRSVQFIRPRVQSLVDVGLVEIVTQKPLRFRITRSGAEILGIGGQPG
ncbi:Fic family protein [Gordonia phthalatica]|uniref:Cell filamentation protein Fic n=1 Tax=Gordonia phthalatica TaxID=1136941 RepID=A0A0N9NDS2_9ACTN|nr:Fic family protein [Gordonia phthalatica]ALG83718.1 cell filamentation protein Fic [Gordonia phthalatica]